MNSRMNELAADMAEVLGEIGVPITWNGNTYQAIVADPSVQLDLQTGGFLPQSEFAIKLLRSLLPTLPAVGQVLQMQGRNYVINGLTDKPTSPMLALHVERK